MVQQLRMFALDRPEITNAAADIGTSVFRDVIGELTFRCHRETTISKGFDRGSNCVMNKGAHLARLFLSNESQRIEIFHFAGKADRKSFCVEFLYVVCATATTHQGGPGTFDVIADRCNEAQPRNHDTTCQIKTPWEECCRELQVVLHLYAIHDVLLHYFLCWSI